MVTATKRVAVDMTQGPIGGHMVNIGIMLALGVVAIFLTNMVDLYFVSQLGADTTAALSFTFPIVMTVTAVSMGLGNGVVAVVARTVGAGDRQVTRALGTDALLLALVIGAALAVLGYLTIRPLFAFLGASPTVVALIETYMKIWYLGIPAFILPQVSQTISRAHGDQRSPTTMMWAMCAINIVLDPILIFGLGPIPAMGLEGAAVASVVARLFYTASMMWVLIVRLDALAPLSLAFDRILASWARLLHIGLPAMATQMVTPLSTAILTKVVALSGTMSVAAYGVGARIEIVTNIYLWAIAGALPPLIGQNIGAGRMERVRQSIALGVRACLLFGLLLVAVVFIGGDAIVGEFTKDPQVADLAVFYLRVIAISYVLGGLVQVAAQALNTLKRPLTATALSMARTFAITVPFALVGQSVAGIHGVFIAVAIAGSLCGAAAWIILMAVLRQEEQRHEAASAMAAPAAS